MKWFAVALVLAAPAGAKTLPGRSIPQPFAGASSQATSSAPRRAERRVARRNGFFGFPLLAVALAGAGSAAAAAAVGATAASPD